MPDEDVPQPVMTVGWWQGTVTGAITAGSTLAIAMEWWHPTKEQLIAIGGLGTFLVTTIFPLIAYFTHKKVTPNENVALTVKDAQVLDAAQAPAIDRADLQAVVNGGYPPHEGDQKP